MYGFMKPYPSFICMSNIFRKVFSFPVATLVGVLVVGFVVTLIVKDTSVQPFHNHAILKEVLSPPLAEGVVFKQAVTLPEGLVTGAFQLGLFFASTESVCSGNIEVVLTQFSHAQAHIMTDLAPSPTLRKRFQFSGFSAGPAEIQIEGLTETPNTAPSLVCAIGGERSPLEGADLDQPVSAVIDWFKIVPGNQNLSSTFPSPMHSLLWLIPFGGFLALAWTGMNPARAE